MGLTTPAAGSAALAVAISAALATADRAAASTYPEAVTATRGLVAYWPLSETSGTRANDAAGSNAGAYRARSGYRLGAPGVLGGASTPAVAFNGTVGYVSVPDSPSLDARSAVSIEAWVKPASVGGEANTYLVNKAGSYRLRFDSAGRLVFSVYTLRGEVGAVSSALPADKPAYVVGTYDGQTVKLYVDGRLVASHGQAGRLASSSRPLVIASNGPLSGHFAGTLGQLAYYHAALSAGQIQAHYSSGAGATTPPALVSRGGCARPFSSSSPWNTPIPSKPTYAASSAREIATMSGVLTSDPTQYTFPVYYATNSTPLKTVSYTDGWFSDVTNGGATLIDNRPISPSQRVTKVPIPPLAGAASGSDAQVIIINTDNGDEWDMSHFEQAGDGSYSAMNIGHYNIAWSGVPSLDANGDPYWLRGAGVPYLAGLVRPCEIAQGHIDHALAFAYPNTTTQFVYPASKSDGTNAPATGIAEGTRLQLDPTISEATLRGWGCTGPCLTIAKALQEYGMYLIDGSGHAKVMMEYESTADWNGAVTASTVSPLPLSDFKVIG